MQQSVPNLKARLAFSLKVFISIFPPLVTLTSSKTIKPNDMANIRAAF